MITAKKRFEILKRDDFRCKYCGRNWKDVSLEVDHIIPKKEWGKDTMENLITACRECNMWKWSDIIEVASKNLYKHKIIDNINTAKDYFYTQWNNNFMWTIDKNTMCLLSMEFNEFLWWDKYISFLLYPPLYYNLETTNININKQKKIFLNWWDFCDEVLSCMLEEFKITLDYYIEECFDDTQRNPKNNNNHNRFWVRLNHELTKSLIDSIWDNKLYVIKKFSLYPDLFNNG